MTAEIGAGITQEEWQDCEEDNLNIHKMWETEEGVIELYIINEEGDNLEGRLEDYVHPTVPDANVVVIPLEALDWSEMVEQAKKGNCLVIEDKSHKLILYPEHLKEHAK